MWYLRSSHKRYQLQFVFVQDTSLISELESEAVPAEVNVKNLGVFEVPC